MDIDPEIYQKISGISSYEETDDLMIHYTVTETCPFRCHGCINALTGGMGNQGRSAFSPAGREHESVERDAKGIADLIRKGGGKEAVIVYYGGEPMLRLDIMSQVRGLLAEAPGISGPVNHMVITSGHFLERAIDRYPDLASGLWLTAVSIDGTREQHDAVRQGTSLDEIRRQLGLFNQIRKGDVLVWSTLRPGMSLMDCFRSFEYLRERKEAEHFFWHCDEGEGLIEDLGAYLHNYRSEFDEIMSSYVGRLASGELLSIVHVNELILYLLTKKRRGTTACGVERMSNFDIIGDGKVHACADLPETMDIGRITDSGEIELRPDAEERLRQIVSYKGDLGCSRCGVEPYCGGRCPVQANTGGLGRARQYCFMMREHVRIVKKYVARIADLMVEKGVTLKDLYRSARLTKYGDVTP
jgi:radical SAM protein with 4Fe4S-binding SPASM domain